MFDLAHVSPPPAALQSTQPPMIRALFANQSLPIVTRIEVAERGEALAIIEATRLGDLYVLAVRQGAAMPPAMARRAQLVAASRNAANADEIMQSVAQDYGESRGSPLFPTIARASATGLLNLPAKPETALLASMAIGEISLSELHPVAVGQIVRSVRAVGEEPEARLFAIEVAIAYGL